MNNDEIDIRLKTLTNSIPEYLTKMKRVGTGDCKYQSRDEVEMEQMNSTLMALTQILGEIAKRIPVPKN